MDDSTTGSVDGGRVAAVLLAAGAGTRFSGGTHKLLAEIDGQPVYLLALTHAVRAAIGPVIVVTGAVELTLPDGFGDRVTLVHNPDWHHGQSTSLLRGVAEARRMHATAVLVGLADQPGVTAEAWRHLAASRSDLAVATYEGRRGHPVRIGARYWDELPTGGDIGARDLLSVHASGVEQVPCPGTATDIDTAEDLATWLRRSPTNSP